MLDHIHLKVKLGERLGFMGPIGSGKTTLIQCISGLQEDYQGTVELFGQNLMNEPRRWITQKITMVPQKPFLFAGTIRHNLSPAEERSDEDLLKVLTAVELFDDLVMFREGLDSWIGEWGLTLSGGQKQRLSLARALLKPSPILILDDCLSAVDSVTEAKIMANILPYMENRAVLWTAHRLSSLQLCSTIYRMDHGRLTRLDTDPLHDAQTFIGRSSHAAS